VTGFAVYQVDFTDEAKHQNVTGMQTGAQKVLKLKQDVAPDELELMISYQKRAVQAAQVPHYTFGLRLSPKEAKVRFVNKTVSYFNGMSLPKGRYAIEISAPDHSTIRKGFEINDHTVHFPVTLHSKYLLKTLRQKSSVTGINELAIANRMLFIKQYGQVSVVDYKRGKLLLNRRATRKIQKALALRPAKPGRQLVYLPIKKALLQVVRGRAEIQLIDTVTGNTTRTIMPGIDIGSVSSAKQGGNLLLLPAYDKNKFLLVDLATGQVRIRSTLGKGQIYSARISANGKRIITLHEKNRLHLWRSDTLGHLKSLPFKGFMASGIRLDQSGKRLLAVDTDNALVLQDLHDGKVLLKLAGHKRPVSAFAFINRGRQIISCDDSGNVHIWNVPR
jgi:WD40 repeat protein